MQSTGQVVGAGCLGLLVGGVIASGLDAPLPWATGIALLVAAVATGFARNRFWGLALVAVWALGAAAWWITGQGSDPLSPALSTTHDAVVRLIPWLLVVSCAVACIVNGIE